MSASSYSERRRGSFQYSREIEDLLNPNRSRRDNNDEADTMPLIPPNGLNKGVPSRIGQYEVLGYLGKGTWAIVHEGINRADGKRYAIKSFNKKKVDRHNLDYTARREIRLLKELKDHPNVVGLRDVVEDRVWLHMVVDLGGRDLQDVLDRGGMTEEQAKKAFRDMMIAVKYVHNHGVCHRDLKPSNLLIGGGKVMLTDFGLGEHVKQSKTASLSEVCGTPDFIAPEIYSHTGYDGFKADIWSCGVTLYVMLFTRPPWAGASNQYKQKQIAAGNFKSPKLQRCSPELNDLLEKLLRVDPSKRPTASEILGHPWLATPNKTLFL
eukprot:TRINITY_DN951_c0_g1_i3.p1 TRINITY_DN951_c0_g1~~TRINITY_DN951_c0_g1_i3.p1  ORF type:complete len:370 (+),score=114.16 TRINITY_DN951_c0_g1_i3:142-1110(+)